VLVQQVLPPDGSAVSWTILGVFAVIEPIDVFLAHLSAIEGHRARCVRMPSIYGTSSPSSMRIKSTGSLFVWSISDGSWRGYGCHRTPVPERWPRYRQRPRTAPLYDQQETVSGGLVLPVETPNNQPNHADRTTFGNRSGNPGEGIRVGEALGLRHEDIDAVGTVIRIRKRHNSNGARVKGRQREIPVPAGFDSALYRLPGSARAQGCRR
jgi:hypothetical protein